MATRVVIDVDGLDGHLKDGQPHVAQLEQHVHFIFVALAVDAHHRLQRAAGQRAQARLRIADMHAAGQRVDKAGDAVSPAALEGHLASELA